MKCAFCNFWPEFHAEGLLQAFDVPEWEIDESAPDVVFESVFGSQGEGRRRWPQARQVWYTGENRTPPMDEFDQCISFYRDIEDSRHLRFPIYHLQNWSDMRNSTRTRDTAFIARNFNCHLRNEFTEKMMTHVDVVCPGAVHNNTTETVGGGNKIDFLSDFRFNICFENTSTTRSEGYVTEKLADAIIAGCTPLYWGDRRVAEDFNSDLFVDLTRFGHHVEPMVDYVVEEILSGQKLPEPIDAKGRLHACGYQKPDVRGFLT